MNDQTAKRLEAAGLNISRHTLRTGAKVWRHGKVITLKADQHQDARREGKQAA